MRLKISIRFCLVQSCPSGFNLYTWGNSNTCMNYVGVSRLDQAHTLCSSGSELPLPASAEEQASFNTIMDNVVGRRQAALNTARYNSEPPPYTAFYGNNPDGDGPWIHVAPLDAAGLASNGIKNWNDIRGNYQVDVICQAPVISTPAKSTVDSCNDNLGVIQMTATLRNVAGSYGQDGNGVITFDRSDLTPSFSGGFLIMEKELGGGDCNRVTVDGVPVCTQVAETVTLKCKYSLEEQTISDTFDVTGQDTTATAEGTGTLGYTLTVDASTEIGDTVNFTINPINSGLVYATVKSCDVQHGSEAVTIIGHNADHCINTAVKAAAGTTRFTSNDAIQGSWQAFKWSTATSEADEESQTLRCTIGLSEAASVDDVVAC